MKKWRVHVWQIDAQYISDYLIFSTNPYENWSCSYYSKHCLTIIFVVKLYNKKKNI